MPELKIDINLISFDDILEMVGLFSDINAEDLKSGGMGEVISKYKPLLSYFVFDDEGSKPSKENAMITVGQMPAVKVLPLIPSLIETLTELTGMMSLPPAKGGNSKKRST